MVLDSPAHIQFITPLRQAMICLLLSLVGMIICHFVIGSGGYEFSAAFFGVMLFTIANCVISIFHDSFMRYTWQSWGLYILLLVILLLLAKGLSGISIWTLPEYRMMLATVVFFYFTASLLVRLIRLMWEFAEEDER